MFCSTFFGKHSFVEISNRKRKFVWYDSYGCDHNIISNIIIKQCLKCNKLIGKIHHSSGYPTDTLTKKEIDFLLSTP